jgi:hypothetical protein
VDDAGRTVKILVALCHAGLSNALCHAGLSNQRDARLPGDSGR